MESRRSRLNIPAGMASSLHLDPVPAAAHFSAIPKIPSPSKTTYSDRFIPCRSSSRLQNFALAEKPSPAKEGGNDAYSRLLRAELFGHDPSPGSPGAGQGSPMSPNKNLFRFKTDHSAPSSPFAAASVAAAHETATEVSTPPRVPRKIPKTPHKVEGRKTFFSNEANAECWLTLWIYVYRCWTPLLFRMISTWIWWTGPRRMFWLLD